jgi:hypothetical protein
MTALQVWQGVVYLSAAVSVVGSVVYLVVYIRSLFRHGSS